MSATAKVSSRAIDAQAVAWIVRRDAGLSPREADEFAAWQSADPRHAAAVALQEKNWSVLDRPFETGKGDVLLARLARDRAQRRRRNGIVAALAVFLLVGSAGYLRFTRPTTATAVTASHAVVLSPERRTLPDGSTVELKSGAEIAVDFAGRARRVALRKGEAHFQVAKDKTRPFVVSADNVEVTAVGTAFSVQLGAKQVQVLVTEGRVAVDHAGEATAATSPAGRPSAPISSAPSAPSFVDAGNRLVVDLDPKAAPALRPAPPAEMAERLAWRAPRVEFTDTPLSEAVRLMNEHGAVKLLVDDPDLGAVKVTGIFRADNTEAFVTLLQQTSDIHADRQGNTITLHRAR